jgi:hypothetical protein
VVATLAGALAPTVLRSVRPIADRRPAGADSGRPHQLVGGRPTGIPNRRQLKADLDRGFKQASPAKPLLLMLFDLNGFKAYNDTFGHPAGDAYIRGASDEG